SSTSRTCSSPTRRRRRSTRRSRRCANASRSCDPTRSGATRRGRSASSRSSSARSRTSRRTPPQRADAGQKARRTLLELDGMLEECDAERRWPELEEEAREDLSSTSVWVTQFGSPAEQQLLNEATQAVEKARAARQPVELQRQLRVVRNLRTASYFRHPKAWEWQFEAAASAADQATDLV